MLCTVAKSRYLKVCNRKQAMAVLTLLTRQDFCYSYLLLVPTPYRRRSDPNAMSMVWPLFLSGPVQRDVKQLLLYNLLSSPMPINSSFGPAATWVTEPELGTFQLHLANRLALTHKVLRLPTPIIIPFFSCVIDLTQQEWGTCFQTLSSMPVL